MSRKRTSPPVLHTSRHPIRAPTRDWQVIGRDHGMTWVSSAGWIWETKSVTGVKALRSGVGINSPQDSTKNVSGQDRVTALPLCQLHKRPFCGCLFFPPLLWNSRVCFLYRLKFTGAFFRQVLTQYRSIGVNVIHWQQESYRLDFGSKMLNIRISMQFIRWQFHTD